MKFYLQTIQKFQELFLAIGIVILMALPLFITFSVPGITDSTTMLWYDVAHITMFFVMMVRPLADIFPSARWIRPLVILRKGVGVLSASVVVSFILAKVIQSPIGYFESFATIKYWSMENLALIAHLADISAVLLLITSNNLSKRILGDWWKRIQRLSYVYFYASCIYVFMTYDNWGVAISMILVTIVTVDAWFINRIKTRNQELS